MTEKCEACREVDAQFELKDRGIGVIYKVCGNCLIYLVCGALPRSSFIHLLDAGHNTREFLLYEDFYDDEGTALQPHGYISE